MLETILSLFLFAPQAPDNYATALEVLRTIARDNPHRTKWLEIGVSDSGKPIVALQIGDGETASLIVGTHHGNEYGSTAVALAVADSLARDPLPEHTVYVVPVLNVSGYNSGSRLERTSVGSIDPNRDYPGPCGTPRPFRSKATRALADFAEAANIVNSATLHTYSPAVLYPWGFSTRDVSTAYDSLFISLAKAATVESGYLVGNSKDVLYAANGTFEDYAFWKLGIWSLLFEMGSSHSPNEGDVKRMIEVNVPGLRRFIATAPKSRAADHQFRGKCDLSVQSRTRLE